MGTPIGEDGSADLQYVKAVANEIGQVMGDSIYGVDKSTVPVGTANIVRDIIQKGLDKRHAILKFDVISNPGFLKEGTAISDCMRPNRIVIGADTLDAVEVMRELYAPYVKSSEERLLSWILQVQKWQNIRRMRCLRPRLDL